MIDTTSRSLSDLRIGGLNRSALCLFAWLMLLPMCVAQDSQGQRATLKGDNIIAFNGIPLDEGWGEPLVYRVTAKSADNRVMGPLGGLPLVSIHNETGGVAFFNTSTVQEPFTIKLTHHAGSVDVEVSGGSNIERFEYKGDYFAAVREFAVRMKKKGIVSQPAPQWAFDPIWETYGFEEDFDGSTILGMLPLLKEFGIKTITIDSGWYGEGRGEDADFHTGDFEVNADTIGTDEDFTKLLRELHDEGFRVRLWWVPGVAERNTKLRKRHRDWFLNKVEASTGDTGDYYLDPTNPEVQQWHDALVKRLVGYGVDGFKQDDIYHISTNDPKVHQAYADLINGTLKTAQSIKPDFVVNSCNCGVCQNFYQFPGQNQIITSDPVGSRQFRLRAKYLHALNVNGSAILGDHVELTRGDVGPKELKKRKFYDTVDFASVVPLGMVLQTKFRRDPGALYRKWFRIYNQYKFHEMQWINVPYTGGPIETYLVQRDDERYFSFFTEKSDRAFRGTVELTNLKPNMTYSVYDIVNEVDLGNFPTSSSRHHLSVNFSGSHVLQVKPVVPSN